MIYTYFYLDFAFVDYLKDSLFLQAYRYSKSNSNLKGMEGLPVTAKSKYDERSRYGLGSNAILIDEVFVAYMIEYQRTFTYNLDQIKTEVFSSWYNNLLQVQNNYNDTTAILTDITSLSSHDTRAYTSWCMVQSWKSEHDLHASSGIYIPVYSYNGLADTITERYKTPYIMSCYAVNYKEKRIRVPPLYVIGILFPITTIPSIIYGVIPRNSYEVSYIAYDIKTGQVALYYHKEKATLLNEANAIYHYNKVVRKIKNPISE